MPPPRRHERFDGLEEQQIARSACPGAGISRWSSREAGNPLCSRRFGSPLRIPSLWPSPTTSSCHSRGRGRGSQAGRAEEAPDAGSAERRCGVSHSQLEQNDDIQRFALIAVAAFAMAPGVGPAFAADDDARIKQCVADNQGEGQTATVVAAYCSCMSKKMSASETQSITTWENSHSREQTACSEEAGAKRN